MTSAIPRTQTQEPQVVETRDPQLSGAIISQYSQDLGRAVRRGMQSRVERGYPVGALPLGYRYNCCRLSGRCRRHPDPKICIDQRTADLIRLAFSLAGKEDRSLSQIAKAISELGLRSRSGNELGVSAVLAILRNPIYCGLIRFMGAIYMGRHQRVVDPALFDRVQQRLGNRLGSRE